MVRGVPGYPSKVRNKLLNLTSQSQEGSKVSGGLSWVLEATHFTPRYIGPALNMGGYQLQEGPGTGKSPVAVAGYRQTALPLGPSNLAGPTVLEVSVVGNEPGWSF